MDSTPSPPATTGRAAYAHAVGRDYDRLVVYLLAAVIVDAGDGYALAQYQPARTSSPEPTPSRSVVWREQSPFPTRGPPEIINCGPDDNPGDLMLRNQTCMTPDPEDEAYRPPNPPARRAATPATPGTPESGLYGFWCNS
jgi:hypothetical protein